MKPLRLLMVVMTLLYVGTFVSGCNDDPKTDFTENKPVITLGENQVTVPYSDSSYTVNYAISHPIYGEQISATCDAEWITDFDTSINGKLTFHILENKTTAQRDAVVNIAYADSDGASLIVTQEISSVAGDTFTVEMLSLGYHECSIDITPTNEEAKFLMELFFASDIEEFGLTSDDALFSYMMDDFGYTGSWYNQSAEQVAADRAKSGKQHGVRLTGLKPGVECVFVAYYYDVERAERISDVYRYVFTAKSAELAEHNFAFDVTIDGPLATATVTPDAAVGRYYFDVMPCQLVDTAVAAENTTIEKYLELWWGNAVYNDMIGGTTTSIIYEERCSQGADNYTFELLANTPYYIFAFEVNEEAVCASVPKYESFTTQGVEMSDLEFTFTVSDLTKCGVKISIDASNDTDPYVAGLTTKDDWESLGNNDAERLDGILEAYPVGSYAYGDGTFEEQRNLTPDTDYVFYVFGYRGGIPTTKLFYVAFTTLSDTASESSIEVKHIGYFDVKAINELYPDFGYLALDDDDCAVYPVELICSEEDAELYFYTWDITPYSDMDWVTDDNRLGRMLYWKERPDVLWTIVYYDTEAWMGAVAKDSEGNYTDQFLHKFPVTRSGVSDPQIFIDWLDEHPDAEPDPSKYIEELYGGSYEE